MCGAENVIHFMKQFIIKILKEKFGSLFPRYVLLLMSRTVMDTAVTVDE